MSNDLSKQLCELCGIEYEKQEPVAVTDGVVQAYAKTKLDFTKPENFVRLYEITSSTAKEGYLNYVCMRLTYEKSWVKDALAKAIREAEWVYG